MSHAFCSPELRPQQPGGTIDIGEGEMVCCSFWSTCLSDGVEFYPSREPFLDRGFEWHFLQIVFCPWPDHTLVPDRNHDENAHH